MTVLRQLRVRLPRADVLYFADQLHVPYGDRSPADLERLLHANLLWFDRRGVDAIAMACNTSCAIGETRGWPKTRARVFDLIEAAAADLAHHDVAFAGVIATQATASSGAYGRAIRRLRPTTRVMEIGAPELVPLVESGDFEGEIARDAVARACVRLPTGVDAVVLGCTHYPLLQKHFALFAGSARLVDPAVAQAERVARFAVERGYDRGSGRTWFVTSGDPAHFRSQLAALRVSELYDGDVEGVEEE